MALLDTYIRGVDSIQLEFTLTDIDTGLPIDIDTLDDVSVEIIKVDKAIPLNTIYWTGTILTTEIAVIDADTGSLACYIDPSVHTTWPLLPKYYVRITETETDVYFDDFRITG